MARGGFRWVPVRCMAHGGTPVIHGFTNGAMIVIAEHAQVGEFVTTGGNPVCFVPTVEEHVNVSSRKKSDREITYTWEVES